MEIENKLTGYPSIDKPWLKYYTEEAINAPLPECTIYEYLWENNKDRLEDIAIIYFGKKITYGELFENIDKTVRAFSAIGVKYGDIVIVATVTTPETIYAFYALNRLGAIPNMVDPRTSVEGIRDYIKEVNAKYVLSLDVACPKTEEAIKNTAVQKVIVSSPADSLPASKKVVYRISNRKKRLPNDTYIYWKSFIENGKNANPSFPPYKKNTCCVIVHTGGTTGMPKGVMLSNDNLNCSVVQCCNSGFDFERYQRWLGIMPPFIAYGIINGVHLPLTKGMPLTIIPNFDPNSYDKLLLKHKPNHIAGVPSHYGKIMESKKLAGKDLSFILSPIVGGDGTKIHMETEISAFLSSHNCKKGLIKGYGMTEVCAAVTGTAIRNANKLGSVGAPFSHSVVSVFDSETGKELSYGKTGEICILSPNTMMGYYENETETANILKKHDDNYIWVHSGDLGYMDEDGCLFIVGRSKRLIIRHDGFKIFPTLIENTVSGHAAVNACCAVGVRDTNFSQGKLPIVYVSLKSEFFGKENAVKIELYKMCRKELPEYEQPIDFIFKKDLPLTTIGKVDYRALEQQAENK